MQWSMYSSLGLSCPFGVRNEGSEIDTPRPSNLTAWCVLNRKGARPMIWLILFLLGAVLDAIVCGASLPIGIALAFLLWCCLSNHSDAGSFRKRKSDDILIVEPR